MYKSVVDFEVDRNIMLITIAQYYLEVMFNTEFEGILKKQVVESKAQLKRLNEASRLANGTYILNMYTNQKKIVKKIIVNH